MNQTQPNPSRSAELYRMVMPEHICPYGLKSRWLLRRQGYKVEDHWLKSRQQTDAFKREHDVETTPQTFIDGKRIGGYDDLRAFLGKPQPDEDSISYTPVIAIFSVALLMALAVGYVALDSLVPSQLLQWFIAISMCLLAIQKLQDLEAFSSMFLNYDLLAQRQVSYAYLYPFGEALAGILMLAGALIWIAAPLALFIGTIGAISVFKAVYVDKRELKCACVGGGSNVPLGFISLTENLMMMAMGLWMGATVLLSA